MRNSLILIVIASALCVAASPAWACSPGSIDSSQELVRRADGIYRVRAGEEISPTPVTGPIEMEPWPDTQVKFVVLDVLKGSPQPAIQVPGALTPDSDPNDRPVPYDFVRPGGRMGNCFAVTFKQGQEYLLFLKSGTPYWSPLAPTAEQVTGPDDPWVIWVKEQLPAKAERPNNAFKPTPLRSTNHMAGTACHVVCSTARRGLT